MKKLVAVSFLILAACLFSFFVVPGKLLSADQTASGRFKLLEAELTRISESMDQMIQTQESMIEEIKSMKILVNRHGH